MLTTPRGEHLFLARSLESAQMYENMAYHMNMVVELDSKLSQQQSILLKIAYKNTILPKLTSWKTLCRLQYKQQNKCSKNLYLLKAYKSKLFEQLNHYCNQIIHLITTKILSHANNMNTKANYVRLRGDFYKYKFEYISDEDKKQFSDKSETDYKVAYEMCKQQLQITNKLNIALSISTFYDQVRNNTQIAYQIAKQAFDQGVNKSNEVDGQSYKDMTLIMSLLKDRIVMWQDIKQNTIKDSNK